MISTTFQYTYEIKINKRSVFKRHNTHVKEYENVKMYAANPWYPSGNGKIKNIFLHTGTYGGYTGLSEN